MNQSSILSSLQLRWSQLQAREQAGIQIASLVVILATLWFASVGPNLQQWRTAHAKGMALDAQLQEMQALQMQAQAIQVQPPLSIDDAVRALKQATTQALGTSAQLSISGDRATLTLQNTTPAALAQWLMLARLNARCVPIEAKLTRQPAASATMWSGTLTMGLPAR